MVCHFTKERFENGFMFVELIRGINQCQKTRCLRMIL